MAGDPGRWSIHGARCQRYVRGWNPCRRFALRQGLRADGSIKYRVIDDHTENDNNKSAGRCQRIHMAGVSTLMLMIKALSRSLVMVQPNSYMFSPTTCRVGNFPAVPGTASN
eukprot:3750424-Amphidinium_carterae.1